MYTIGMIAFQGHCSSLSLFKEGSLIWAASEERFSRIKEDSSFPELALKACLEQNQISIHDIENISFAWNPWLSLTSFLKRSLKEFSADFIFGYRKNGKSSRFNKFKSMLQFSSRIKKEFGYCPKVTYLDHHSCHAAVAFAHCDFTDSLCLVIDGCGESATTSLFHCQGSKIVNIKQTEFPHSIGIFYAAVTQFLGYESDIDEYKVMGLASYGQPEFLNEMKKIISFDSKNLVHLNLDFFSHHKKSNQFFSDKFYDLFGKPESFSFEKKANIAHSAQTVLNNLVFEILNEIKKQYGHLSESICLSGGVFQNCTLNRSLREREIFKQMFITPLCSDLGTAVGAGYFYQLQNKKSVKSFKGLNLGSEFSDSAIQQVLEKYKVQYEKSENISQATAQLLSHQKIIGWFQGRSEFGPRALGFRSILADPRPKDMKDRLNIKIKKREQFRPFAPAVLNYLAGKYFVYENTADLRFMIETVGVDPKFCNDIPSVVHVDMSARVQIVNEEDNFMFFSLLKEFEKITRAGALINTSFNVKDEPIIDSPEDALKCFINAELDCLVIGSFIVHAENNSQLKKDLC